MDENAVTFFTGFTIVLGMVVCFSGLVAMCLIEVVFNRKDRTMFTEEIEAGAKLLDEKVPEWAKGIDLAELDIAHACNCVVGQSCNAKSGQDYWDRMNEWFPEQDQFQASYDHGFNVAGSKDEDLAQLTNEWIVYIQERRKANV